MSHIRLSCDLYCQPCLKFLAHAWVMEQYRQMMKHVIHTMQYLHYLILVNHCFDHPTAVNRGSLHTVIQPDPLTHWSAQLWQLIRSSHLGWSITCQRIHTDTHAQLFTPGIKNHDWKDYAGQVYIHTVKILIITTFEKSCLDRKSVV